MERIHNLGPACQIREMKMKVIRHIWLFFKTEYIFWKLVSNYTQIKEAGKANSGKNALILEGKLVLKCVPFIIIIPKRKKEKCCLTP